MSEPAATFERTFGVCGRCGAELPAAVVRCPGCRAPFHGAGRFQRIDGPGPSRAFELLFGEAARPGPSQ